MLKIHEEKISDHAKQRHSWQQLLTLRAGRALVIEVENYQQWKTAQKRAHDVAARKKWKIITSWLPNDKIGRIERLS